MVVLELLHLKMEVTVSEPCDVIRVPSNGLIPIIFYIFERRIQDYFKGGEIGGFLAPI